MPRWTWRDEPIAGGRAILVDVDGVISDGTHRQHHLAGRRKDWAAFFAAAHADEPILAVLTLLDIIEEEAAVVLLTARPEQIHDETVAWLAEYDTRWDLLVMRSVSDHGASPDVKELAVRELRDAGFELVLALDDDPRNIAVFESLGIPSLYIHSGYY